MTIKPRSRQRAYATLGVLTAVSLSLAACSSSPAPTPEDTAATSAGDAPEEGAAGGDLVIGVTTDPDTLFPWKATQFQAVRVLENVYGTLTEYDTDLDVVPGLAESWEASEDGMTVTFKLREGVTFHDGSDFDSEDVLFSFDKIMDEATAAVSASSLNSVESVEATDATTVVLNLTAPDAALPAKLAVLGTSILSSDDTEEGLNTAPNGTGAFKFDNRVPNQSVTLAVADNYWGETALLNSVEFRVIPDEASIVAAMQSGNVQFTAFDDPLVADTAKSDTIEIVKTPQLSYHVLQFNARNGEVQDVNVRLAVQCAIDRQEVLDTAALGEGEITGPVTSPAYKSDTMARPCPTRDLDKAQEYLDKAGKSDGVTIKAIVSQGEYATSVDEAQNIKSQLADANINLELEVLESGAYVDRWIAADFEAAVALNGGNPDPDVMYGRYFPSDGNLNQVAGYTSDSFDELFAKGKSAFDPTERKAIYDEISKELEDNAVWVWLFTSYTYTATDTSVQGFVPMANGSLKTLRVTSIN